MKRHPAYATLFTLLILAGAFSASTWAGEKTAAKSGDLNKATANPAARKQAVDSLPMDQLSPPAREKVRWVLDNTSMFRRLPLRVIVCDPELYNFACQHPDVVVNIWEVLGVSHIVMRQTAPDVYQVSDDIGTTGTFEYLYRSRDTQVAYIDGKYGGKLFGQHVRGRGIVILKSGFVRDVEGRSFISSRLDAFMNVEPGTAEFLTKTFQPVVGKVADGNFIQTADFLGSLSRTAEVNQRGMQRLTARLDKVQPEVKEQFGQVVGRVAQRAGKGESRPASQEAQSEPSLAQPQDPLVARREKLADADAITPEAPLPPPAP